MSGITTGGRFSDFSDPVASGSFDTRPDAFVPGIPDRFLCATSRISHAALRRMREVLSIKENPQKTTNVPEGETFPELKRAYCNDMRRLQRAISAHGHAQNSEISDALDYSEATVVFDTCYLLLIKYWQNGMLEFCLDDRDFILGDETVQFVIINILLQIIKDEFKSRKGSLDIRSIVGKILTLEALLGCKIDVGSDLHPNLINVLDTERKLLQKQELISA